MKKFVICGVSLIMSLFIISCTSTTGLKNNAPGYIPIIKKDIEIVGPVNVEYTVHGVLGIIPELSLYSWGNRSSYVALLEKAVLMGADDVVNIKVDIKSTNIFIFYNERTWIASGLAVKYLKGAPNQPDLGR